MFDKYLTNTCPKLMSGERQTLLCVQSFIVSILFILSTSVSTDISLPHLIFWAAQQEFFILLISLKALSSNTITLEVGAPHMTGLNEKPPSCHHRLIYLNT